MGALHFGKCYETSQAADAALWSSVAPVVVPGSPTLLQPNPPPFFHVAEFVNGSWLLRKYEGSTLKSSHAVPASNYQTCNVAESATDGFILAWAVVAVWGAAWAISMLRRPLSMR
ncbi:conserved protein of unknown function [Sterolibacterium denitrificans]|uniref:Uncharacterized protein n=1 Tax=Sterolibacterium denitrificans TaxID=157592 RepID=A0A7Z7HSE7_9PROT|nr:hypothetical protein [Sterolibacterium denitrificans]SMB28116.1 conserved protein of unknown function [Sterolibacterium denitrificans]